MADVVWDTLVEAHPSEYRFGELMLFGSPGCAACETLKPRLIEWCRAQGVELLYYNVENDANRDLGKSYGFQLIPAVVLWADSAVDAPVYRAAGAFISFDRMQDAIQPPTQ